MAPDDREGSPRAAAVLVAAGRSTRMGSVEGGRGDQRARKPLLLLDGRPMLAVTCAAFDACQAVEAIVIAAHPDDLDAIEALRSRPELAKVVAVVPGGAERADSVGEGARAAPAGCDVLCVHDAARPLVSPALVGRTIEAAARDGAAVPCLPLSDTIKESEDGRRALSTVDRSRLWAAQTPQCFRTERFLALLDEARRDGFRPTDDAGLWERYVGPVAIVPGEAANRKVTTPEDLEIARALLALRTAEDER